MADSIETSGSLDASLLANLTWQTSGVVEKVNVNIGDTVKAGDILAFLSTTSVPANVITAQSDLVNAQKNLDTLLNSNLEKAQAQLDLAIAKEALEDAEDDIASYQYKRATSEDIDYWEAQLTLAQDKVDRMEDAYNRTNGLSDSDTKRAQAKTNLYNAEQDYNTTLATLNWYTSTPTNTEYDIDQGNYEFAKAQFEDAQREWERLQNGATEEDIRSAQAKIDAAQSTVNSMHIIAPFDGVVLTIDTIPGSQVFSNTTAFTISNLTTLKVDALVDELDIFRVEIGDPVEIMLDALPDLVMSGEVSNINPVGKTVNGLVKYTVTISINNQGTPILFGATANVTILINEPQERLTVPLSAIKNDSLGEYVFKIMSDGSLERVNIQSYDLIDGLVTITGNLEAGDTLQLQSADSDLQNDGPGGMFGG
jgi:HlyD family secretion protein